jgi:hypothetical protein
MLNFHSYLIGCGCREKRICPLPLVSLQAAAAAAEKSSTLKRCVFFFLLRRGLMRNRNFDAAARMNENALGDSK